MYIWNAAALMPENLFVFSNEELRQEAQDASEAESRAETLAELCVRRFLNPRSVPDDMLEPLPRRALQQLDGLKNLCPNGRHLPPMQWGEGNDLLRQCAVRTRERLCELMEGTDGYIPVIGPGNQGYFLPFHLEQAAKDGPAIVDRRGQEIPGWREPLKALRVQMPGLEAFRCVVHVTQCDGLPPLTGPSLMLPLAMAFWRKTGALEEYMPYRLLATGEIRNGHIVRVESGPKKAATEAMFAEACLVYPDDGEAEGGRCIPLPSNLSLDEVRRKLEVLIESKGLCLPDFKTAVRRIRELRTEVDGQDAAEWKWVIGQVRNLLDSLPEDCDSEARLEALMLQSAILCHLGRTEEAHKANREAFAFAKNHGDRFVAKCLRLGIEELVVLADEEDWAGILERAAGLEEQLQRLLESSPDDDVAKDLAMRFYGTMGQAYAYGTLSKWDGCTEEKAKEAFLKAKDLAIGLDSAPDIAQDRNYVHLWHALFRPGTPEEEKAYREADNHIRRELQDMPRAAARNRSFLRRSRAMARYRALLANGTIGEQLMDLDVGEEAEPWLKGLTQKYLGALAAARGERDEAKECFEAGARLLGGMPLFRFFRMTVLAEAYRSLGDETWREKAQAAGDWDSPQLPPSADKWKNYLDHPEKAPFPGLSYWY